MAELSHDILDRLSENSRLYKHPGWGRFFETQASFIGLHGFWVLLGISLLITLVFLRTDSHWFFNEVLFGWLY